MKDEFYSIRIHVQFIQIGTQGYTQIHIVNHDFDFIIRNFSQFFSLYVLIIKKIKKYSFLIVKTETEKISSLGLFIK